MSSLTPDALRKAGVGQALIAGRRRCLSNFATMNRRCHAPGEMGEVMAEVKITVRRNGPYRVEAPEGSIEIVDADGTPYDLTGKTAFSLCRCGGSVNKPFCDGTHASIKFHAT